MAKLKELGVDFEHWCFACGQLNAAGMHLDFDVSRDRAETRYIGQQRHQGYDGALHGGVVAALLDETMGWAIFHQGIWGVTAKLNVTYRRPVPVGEELRVIGEVVRDRGRALEMHGTVSRASDGEVLAEADGVFLRMPDERRRELEKRYSTAADAFERVRAAVSAEEGRGGPSEDPDPYPTDPSGPRGPRVRPVRAASREARRASRTGAPAPGRSPTAIGQGMEHGRT